MRHNWPLNLKIVSTIMPKRKKKRIVKKVRRQCTGKERKEERKEGKKSERAIMATPSPALRIILIFLTFSSVLGPFKIWC